MLIQSLKWKYVVSKFKDKNTRAELLPLRTKFQMTMVLFSKFDGSENLVTTGRFEQRNTWTVSCYLIHLVTGICDSNKSRVRHNHSFLLKIFNKRTALIINFQPMVMHKLKNEAFKSLFHMRKTVYRQYYVCIISFKTSFFHLKAIFFDIVKNSWLYYYPARNRQHRTNGNWVYMTVWLLERFLF